ncbi:MAG: glycosyltransferase family 1 protein [Anaeromyxobacter sp.]|nr:glycosyltransferase family 1 protein [Anaeromyxobacter sp.]
MSLAIHLRTTAAYAWWSRAREQQQLAAFRQRLGAVRAAPAREPAALGSALGKRRVARRPVPARPHFAIFGANDWEQHGLWPAFASLGQASHFDYAPQARAAGSPSQALRGELGRQFLAFVESSSRTSPVDVAFLYASGAYLDPDLLRELGARGIWTVVLGLDDKQQLPGPPQGGLVGWQMEAARGADLYWTTWRAGVDWLAAEGARPWYAPEAASPDFFAPTVAERDLDVLWLGRGYGARLDLVRRLGQMGFQVSAHGPGWPGGPVPFESMVDLYGRAKVVLGMGGVGHTDRIKHLKGRDFEVPMCGAVYLTSFNPELADHYAIGSEILCYASVEECAEVLAWVLHRPGEQERIRAAARARSLRDHTWVKRIVDLTAQLRGP